MAQKIPFTSSILQQDAITITRLEGGTLHLFKNDYTPVDGTILADLTEADFDGYAPLTVSGWSAAALNVDNKAETEAPLQTWTKAAGATPNTVYGCWYEDTLGDIVFIERNPAGGILITAVGQTFSILPRQTYKSEF